MASCIEGGGVLDAGSRPSSAASTRCRSCSKKSGSVIEECCGEAGILPWSCGFRLAFGLEGFGDDSAVGFLEKDFDFAFRFFELLLAFGGKGDSFFKKLHGVVERELRAFECTNDFFETREAPFEIGLLGVGFFGSGCVHVFFAVNSLRQGGEGKQVASLACAEPVL
jgi:hypothetical protein